MWKHLVTFSCHFVLTLSSVCVHHSQHSFLSVLPCGWGLPVHLTETTNTGETRRLEGMQLYCWPHSRARQNYSFDPYTKTYLSLLIVKDLSPVQSLSRVQLFAIPWTAACQASLSITNSRNLLRLMCIESVMPSSHFILCRSLVLLPPPSHHQGLFQWVSSPHQVAKVLEFQLQHQSLQWTPRTDLL